MGQITKVTKESRLNAKRNVLGTKCGTVYHRLQKKNTKPFKRLFTGTFFDILQTEDSYIDLDTTIVKMKRVIHFSLPFIIPFLFPCF